jgi:hypothetical protein
MTKKLLKIQYLSKFRLKNFQISFIKSYSLMAFQQRPECNQIPL